MVRPSPRTTLAACRTYDTETRRKVSSSTGLDTEDDEGDEYMLACFAFPPPNVNVRGRPIRANSELRLSDITSFVTSALSETADVPSCLAAATTALDDEATTSLARRMPSVAARQAAYLSYFVSLADGKRVGTSNDDKKEGQETNFFPALPATDAALALRLIDHRPSAAAVGCGIMAAASTKAKEMTANASRDLIVVPDPEKSQGG